MLDLPAELNCTFLEQNDFDLTRRRVGFRFLDSLGFALGLNLPFLRSLEEPENLKKLNSFSLLFATTNAWGMALSLLRYRGKLKAKVVFLSMGALEASAGWLHKLIFRKITTSVMLATLSKPESGFLSGVTKKKVAYLPFSVDTDFWHEEIGPIEHPWFSGESPFFFSIGNDRHRDFETLVQSWRPEFPELRIVTKLKIDTELPRNIKVLRSDLYERQITDEDLRRIYSKALAVVVPLHDTIQPSGQSVTLQAIACSAPVIIARNRGFWDDELLQEGINIRFYYPENHEMLTQQLEDFLNKPDNYRRSNSMGVILSAHFSLKEYGSRIGELIKTVRMAEADRI